MTTNALMELADRLRTEAAWFVPGGPIPKAKAPDRAALLNEAAAEIERLTELADKYKWQVRDTCVRAERAETQLRTAASEGGGGTDGWKHWSILERAICTAIDEGTIRLENGKVVAITPEVSRDAERWRMFRRYFDTPAKREQLRCFLGLKPGDFYPSIESMIDTALDRAMGDAAGVGNESN